jgi:hypothetical protein
MNANDFIPLLGLTSDDDNVKAFLANCGIIKIPKLKKDDDTVVVTDKRQGLEITFRDERYLGNKLHEYEEGALVLSNVRMYGDGKEGVQPFKGDLPLDLNFDFGRKEVLAKLNKKPSSENKEMAKARWDFDKYCLFLTFDKLYTKIRIVAVQLPVT